MTGPATGPASEGISVLILALAIAAGVVVCLVIICIVAACIFVRSNDNSYNDSYSVQNSMYGTQMQQPGTFGAIGSGVASDYPSGKLISYFNFHFDFDLNFLF